MRKFFQIVAWMIVGSGIVFFTNTGITTEEKQPSEYTLVKDANANINRYIITNTNPVKAREEEAERQQATNNFRQRIAAKQQQADREGWVWGYTPEQQKRLKALDAALDNLYKEAAQHKWTPDQMMQYERSVVRAKNHILPHRMPRPPTPQEQITSNIWTDPNTGRRFYWNPTNHTITRIDKVESGYRLGIQYFVVAVVTAGLIITIITLRGKKDPKQKPVD